MVISEFRQHASQDLQSQVLLIAQAVCPALDDPDFVVQAFHETERDLVLWLAIQDAKRASYLDLGECWYVLGSDARGRCIGAADEIPPGCGVMVLDQGRLQVARAAPRRARGAIPFGIWMALARATPVAGLDEEAQALLADCADPADGAAVQ